MGLEPTQVDPTRFEILYLNYMATPPQLDNWESGGVSKIRSLLRKKSPKKTLYDTSKSGFAEGGTEARSGRASKRLICRETKKDL